jgi:predicted nuclease of predicted toxin-antitoxin system
MPHCGILRLVNLAAKQQGTLCQQVIALYEQELQAGALVTAELNRVRIRPPDNKT